MNVAEKDATISMQEEENKSMQAEKDAEIDRLRAENNNLKNNGGSAVKSRRVRFNY